MHINNLIDNDYAYFLCYEYFQMLCMKAPKPSWLVLFLQLYIYPIRFITGQFPKGHNGKYPLIYKQILKKYPILL